MADRAVPEAAVEDLAQATEDPAVIAVEWAGRG